MQISETRSDLEKASRNATTTELDLRKELDMQRRHMEEEMAALSLQHSKRLEEMIEQHKEELRKLEGIKDEEIKVLREVQKEISIEVGCHHLDTIALFFQDPTP